MKKKTRRLGPLELTLQFGREARPPKEDQTIDLSYSQQFVDSAVMLGTAMGRVPTIFASTVPDGHGGSKEVFHTGTASLPAATYPDATPVWSGKASEVKGTRRATADEIAAKATRFPGFSSFIEKMKREALERQREEEKTLRSRAKKLIPTSGKKTR